MALGVFEALKNASAAGKTLVVGTDGISEAKKSVQAGEMSATVAEFPFEEGQLGVEVALRLLGCQPVPPWVVSPNAVIRKVNVAKFPRPTRVAKSFPMSAVALSGGTSSLRAPMLAMRGVSKTFGRARVLNNVDLTLQSGEVRAVLGENGAGKSTLMKVLFGIVPPDAGEIEIDTLGAVQIESPRHALSLGIGLVSQELSLVPQLDVAQNIFLGQTAGLDIIPRGRTERRQSKSFSLSRLIFDRYTRLQARHGRSSLQSSRLLCLVEKAPCPAWVEKSFSHAV